MGCYLAVKTLHLISATILFGTGVGIAFLMLRSYFVDDMGKKLFAAQHTVTADYVFTLPATIVQPLSGFWLLWKGGFDWSSNWLVATYAIYIIAACCWIPVIWIQIRIKNLLSECIESGAPLTNEYRRLFIIWFALGWPAFIGLIIVFFLMVMKPL